MKSAEQYTESTPHEEMASCQGLEAVEKNGTNNSQTMTAADISIDSRNEVTGLKLLVLHTGLCFCTFLVGLVSHTF